ncbi:MAG: peptidylprolyl isomerase [Bacteroidales bacterium]
MKSKYKTVHFILLLSFFIGITSNAYTQKSTHVSHVKSDSIAQDSVLAKKAVLDTLKNAKTVSFEEVVLPVKPIVIDQIVAVIGNKKIKLSEVEAQATNMRLQMTTSTDDLRCDILEQLLISNLYALQAEEDSINVSDNEVDSELEARIRYFTEQMGSREKLEAFYQKSILEIKEENRELIRISLVSRTMERKITEDVKVTPSEVRRFFGSMDRDSVPLVPTEYQLGVIVKKPKISRTEMNLAKQQITELRTRIEKGESFAALAGLYSEDPGSRRTGGDVGFGERGMWASEFESMAFSLKVGELSPVIETNFGFHILEVLERKGERVRVRHILIRPKPGTADLMRAQKELDSVSSLIRNNTFTFQEAVKVFSDEAGRQADGIYLSPMTRKPAYAAEEIEPIVFFAIEKLMEGEVTHALNFQDEATGQMCFRLFYVIKKVSPHKANLVDDYDRLYNMALQQARNDKMSSWMKNKITQTYVRLMGDYAKCAFTYQWKM